MNPELDALLRRWLGAAEPPRIQSRAPIVTSAPAPDWDRRRASTDATAVTPGAGDGFDPMLAGEMALGFTPIVGDAMSLRDAFRSGRDAVQAAGEGRLGATLGNAALTGLNLAGSIPILGAGADAINAARRGARGVGRAATEAAPAADEATRTLTEMLGINIQPLGAGESITRARRGGGAIPNFRTMDPEQAMLAARNGAHLRRVGEGNQYVGAPRGVQSPKQLREIRDNYDRLVEQGLSGGDWYNRAMRSTVEAAGYNPERQRLFAREAGLWSAQATPDVNLGAMLHGHNAYEFGTPALQVRTRAQAARYNAARDAGREIPLGPKTGQYTNKFDPTSPNSHISTNDIWHFRNWQYTDANGKPWSAGGTPQMHSFTDAESLLAADRANAAAFGGRTDWDAASIQAAPWVYAKGVSLHERFPNRYPTVEAGVQEAAKTYLEFMPKYTANATFEAVPGIGTGHLEGLAGAPGDVRAAYSADPRSSWSNLTDQERTFRDQLPEPLRGAADGRDILYDAAGMYVRPTREATGFFRAAPDAPLETNPAFVARPLVSLEAGPSGARVRASDQRALDAVEGLRAYLDAQNAGAWHKVLPEGRVAESSSLRLPMDRQLAEDEVRRLAGVVEPRGFDVVDTGQGVTLLNSSKQRTGKTLGKELKGPRNRPEEGLGAAIKQALPDATGAERVRVDSGFLMQDGDAGSLLRAENAGSGRATAELRRLLTDPALPALLDNLDRDPRIRQAALDRFARDIEFAERLGTVPRADIQRARQIVATSGLRGLFEALEQGVALPILAVGALGAARAASEGGELPPNP